MEKAETYAQQVERKANDLWKLAQKTYEKTKKTILVDQAHQLIAEIRKYLEEKEGRAKMTKIWTKQTRQSFSAWKDYF